MSRKGLVVDDEKLIVKGLRFSLEQDGMEVDCAYDGEEALEKAKAGEYDIILLDLMLPKMDGLEVCQQNREFSNVPIIMLTAKGEDMDKILGLEYGADDYVTKPFNILEVKARIKAIIRRAVVNSPKLIFADEPTGALDSASAISLMKIIASLNHTLHSNIFLVTHDALCASYADRVLFLKDGKIFSELVKGEKKNREFYHEILDNISLLGE